MANIPLIPGAQQTYARFRRHGKKLPVDFGKTTDDKTGRARRSFKRRLTDRRHHNLNVRLERRSYQDRRNQRSIKQSNANDRDNLPGKGRHINTTA